MLPDDLPSHLQGRFLDDLIQAYAEFTDALTLRYTSTLATLRTIDLRTRQEFLDRSQTDVSHAADRFQGIIWELIEFIENTIKEEYGVSDVSLHVRDALHELSDVLLEKLITQTHRDVHALQANLMRFQMRIRTRVDRGELSFSNALIAERESELKSASLKYTDGAGRKWQSTVYVQVESNGSIFEMFNEAHWATAMALRVDQIRVNEGDAFTDMAIEDWRSYSEENIHPRSTRFIQGSSPILTPVGA